MTAPAGGSTVAGTTTVTATAADNVGVVGVQFSLDGANLGPERPTAPYSFSWDTKTASNPEAIAAHRADYRIRDVGSMRSTFHCRGVRRVD